MAINIVGHGGCTANFVFKGLGERTGKLYLATAAHCVDQDIGAEVRLGGSGGSVIGSVAYSAWRELDVGSIPCLVIFSCYSDDPDIENDFALIEINSESKGKVHPAVLGFGGPTGLANYTEVAVGDRILTFGATPLRPGPNQLDSREGYIVSKEEPWTYQSYVVTPAPGDSGSDVMLSDGKALGIMVTLNDMPPAANGISALDRALEFAASRGWEVELQTWPLMYGGLLPSIN